MAFHLHLQASIGDVAPCRFPGRTTSDRSQETLLAELASIRAPPIHSREVRVTSTGGPIQR